MKSFPGKSEELHGRWIGVSENIGPLMTFKILTDSGESICQSLVCPADDPSSPNLRANADSVEPIPSMPPPQHRYPLCSQGPIPNSAESDKQLLSSTAPALLDELELRSIQVDCDFSFDDCKVSLFFEV